MRKSICFCLCLLLGGVGRVGAQDTPLTENQGQILVPEETPVEQSPIPIEGGEVASPAVERFWFRGEYLLWWIKDSNFPALVTTGSSVDPRPGSLDASDTAVLFGNRVGNLSRSGGRFFGGWRLGDDRLWGLEFGYLFLGNRSVGPIFTTDGNSVLARPFFNANAGIQDSSLVGFPGQAMGNISVTANSFLQGSELNLTSIWRQGEKFRLEGLAGFRWLNLNEGLGIVENTLVSPTVPVFTNKLISVSDQFETRNNFYGGQVGLRADFRRKRLFANLWAKVALGDSNQVVSIHGATAINTTPPTAVNAGLLALSSNSGQFNHNSFAVVPEVGLNLGLYITNRLRAFAGYNFIYWSNVARPGDQVDTTINPNLVPTSLTFGAPGGPARPAAVFRENSFFAHGLNFGFEFRY